MLFRFYNIIRNERKKYSSRGCNFSVRTIKGQPKIFFWIVRPQSHLLLLNGCKISRRKLCLCEVVLKIEWLPDIYLNAGRCLMIGFSSIAEDISEIYTIPIPFEAMRIKNAKLNLDMQCIFERVVKQ